MLSIITGLARSRGVLASSAVIGLVIVSAACDKMPLLAPQLSTIIVTASSSIVQVNGVTELRATVLEQGGTPVQNGTVVTFSTNLGALSPSEARTMNGVATVQFVSNGQNGRASIRAVSGSAASEAIELVVGAAAVGRVTLTANPSSVPAAGGTTTITAVVFDASGNMLSGVPVSFATTTGTFSSGVVNTDLTGAARTTLTTSREASVTATSGATTSAAITILSHHVHPTIALSASGKPYRRWHYHVYRDGDAQWCSDPKRDDQLR